jgi:23S rRNA (guanosine2251-2'-O)-methyltransferase
MPGPILIIRQCLNLQCRFRFPAPATGSAGRFCPRCGWETEIITASRPGVQTRSLSAMPSGPVVEALLDNIRSTFNVGSIFRASDGAGLRRLHLCGVTPTPENPKVAKTALGAESSVKWAYHLNAVHAARELKNRGFQVCALEITPGSCSIFEAAAHLDSSPLLLVVGNEVTGVDPELIDLSDVVFSIPMQGHKESLNVSLAFGIAAYALRFAPNINKA